MSTLIACELLSDVHELCAKRSDGDELVGLRNYLTQDRGWRCLAVLQLLGVRGLSCGRELVALLVALYPVGFQEEAKKADPKACRDSTRSATLESARNPYVKFHCDDDTVDTVDIVPHAKRKSTKSGRNGVSYEGNVSSRRRTNRRHSVGGKVPVHHKQRSLGVLETRRDTPETASSGSELVTDGVDRARSLTLKIRLNPMDFEYFTSVVRSDEEQKWQAALYELPPRPVKKTSQDYVDQRIKDVLDARISNYETSLLIIQLLQGLRDYDIPAEQTPAVQVLKFALDTLWSLQFGIDGAALTNIQCATLKAEAARLMLMALERALRANEPTTAVIHNGLLPMAMRLLEDACSKPVNVFSPEEGSLLQEFIFATAYGIVTFLYCLLHQHGAVLDKLCDFLALFLLFIETQDGELVSRTIFAIVDLPSVDPARSLVRARKVIDMIGALMNALKSVRRDISSKTQNNRTKRKQVLGHVQVYHHSDLLGKPYAQMADATVTKRPCSISSFFAILTNLLKESHRFPSELQVRLIKVATMAGTCCCFQPKVLVSSVVTLLQRHDPVTYAPAVALLERTLFKELGAYSETELCQICDRSTTYSWDFLELYADLLTPDEPKLCYCIMAHLLKVAPSSRFHVRRELLQKVFYPTFLKAKTRYKLDKKSATAKFLVQSSLSAISCLILNAQICEVLTEMNGLEEALALLSDATFTRSVYALLEVTVIIEILRNTAISDPENTEKPALRSLFDSLEKETTKLLEALKKKREEEIDEAWNVETCDENVAETSIDTDNDKTEVWTDTSSYYPKVSYSLDTVASPEIDDHADTKKLDLHEASAAWRAAAGVALCSPKFRTELSSHGVSVKSLELFKTLATCISTDSISGT